MIKKSPNNKGLDQTIHDRIAHFKKKLTNQCLNKNYQIGLVYPSISRNSELKEKRQSIARELLANLDGVIARFHGQQLLKETVYAYAKAKILDGIACKLYIKHLHGKDRLYNFLTTELRELHHLQKNI